MSPFKLLYGINDKIPITLDLHTLKWVHAIEDETYLDALHKRIMCLQQLEEQRKEVVDMLATCQQEVKVLFYKKAKYQEFKIGDLVLL